ncbi:MAG: OB-fold nucleic acid binding domain-containing protein, partial [Haliea sp.]
MPSSSSTHKPGLRPALRLGPPTLTTPVERLRGVGPRVQEKLAKLGITRLGDVLFHLPFRYSDRTRIVPIGSLLPGQELQVEGTIELTQVKMGRRRSLLCRISDGSGALTLRMFHFSRQQQAQLERGRRIRCYGTVRSGPQTLEMVHPEYQVLNTDEPAPLAETLTPVYP